MVTLRGSCHCGHLGVEFSTDRETASFNPRACDCAFCRKHGAAYVSDPAGTLSITERNARTLREYRQGSNTARFLMCGQCGVLVAVVFDHESRVYGAVNASCLDAAPDLGPPVSASPQLLDPDQKVSRWLQLWVPDVALPDSLD